MGSAVLTDLTRRGVNLRVADGYILAAAPPGILVDADRFAIRANRPELIAEIQKRCRCSMDRRLWIDRPAPRRYGWMRTTCRQCGRFIGCRPGAMGGGG